MKGNKAISPNEFNRLQQATDDLLLYCNETFGDTGTYDDPIERAIFALRLAKEHLQTRVRHRMMAQERLYQQPS